MKGKQVAFPSSFILHPSSFPFRPNPFVRLSSEGEFRSGVDFRFRAAHYGDGVALDTHARDERAVAPSALGLRACALDGRALPEERVVSAEELLRVRRLVPSGAP